MEQAYLSVKVTISPLPNGRFRSRVESQSAAGSNFGAGHEFSLKSKKPHGHTHEAFAEKLSAGSASREEVEEFGKWLFGSAFAGDARIKYEQCKAIAQDRGSKLRICLALQSGALMNIPWEFLHDGSNFLLQHGYPVVRVLDELVGARSSFAPLRNVLIAAANPTTDQSYTPFDAQGHVDTLKALLNEKGCNYTLLPSASKDALLNAISSKEFDGIYFVGHGEAAKFQTRLICERNGAPEPLDASRLAQAFREVDNVRFVYLNSCSTAKTSETNAFIGVAQRLMLDGNVAAVAAMQVDIRQSAGLAIATAFFGELKSKNPEEAMHSARMAYSDASSFGIPTLYTYLDAPEQFEENCLKRFLNIAPKSSYALVLPSFFIGLPAEDGQPEIPKDGKFRFPGETFADIEAAFDVVRLLNRVAQPDEITISSLRKGLPAGRTHYFLFGSKSNTISEAVRKEFAEQFYFDYKDKWLLHDKLYSHNYGLDNPSELDEKRYEQRDDYGILQKIKADERVYFVIAGLGSRATRGCAWYLYKKWKHHLSEEKFAIVLKFPAGLDVGAWRVIDRETGSPKELAA